MKTKLHKILIRTHIASLTTAILNTFVKNLTHYSLQGNIEFGVEILTIISGLILFFFYLKPFKKINIYFSIYITATFFLIIGLIIRGIFGALIISLILYPIVPNDKKFESNGIVISTPFQGFMARCCLYQIKEKKLLIFEKDYGIFESERPIDFETINIEQTETELILTYSTDIDKKLMRLSKK